MVKKDMPLKAVDRLMRQRAWVSECVVVGLTIVITTAALVAPCGIIWYTRVSVWPGRGPEVGRLPHAWLSASHVLCATV
jgi:hypothetical protein